MSESIVEPTKLFPILAKYGSEAESILDIEEDEANRLDERGDGDVLTLDALIRGLKDALTYPETSYYAKLAEGDSIHHGWSFDFFANTRGREIPLLQGVKFGDSETGLISAFFVSAMLPTIGATWHGLYERDYSPIETLKELRELLLEDSLKREGRDDHAILEIPLGLRVKDVFGTKKCRCLCFSETDGLLDIEVVVFPDGRADDAMKTVLCEPAHRTLF